MTKNTSKLSFNNLSRHHLRSSSRGRSCGRIDIYLNNDKRQVPLATTTEPSDRTWTYWLVVANGICSRHTSLLGRQFTDFNGLKTLSVFGVGSPVPVARLWVGRGTSGSPLPPTSVRGARRSIGRRAVTRSLCRTWRRSYLAACGCLPWQLCNHFRFRNCTSSPTSKTGNGMSTLRLTS